MYIVQGKYTNTKWFNLHEDTLQSLSECNDLIKAESKWRVSEYRILKCKVHKRGGK